MNKQPDRINHRAKARRLMAAWAALVLAFCVFIILGWGVVQVGMSVQSHDASQRSQGFLCLFGGLLIAFAKEILTAIGVV